MKTKTCSKCGFVCGVELFRVGRNVCKKCFKKQQKEYRLKNKDKQKEYRLKNKDKLGKQREEYRLKNKDKIGKQKKEYRLKNKDKIGKKQKEYDLKNKDKQKEYNLKNKDKLGKQREEYRLKNKDKITDVYIKSLLSGRGITSADVPQEMVEVKREQIIMSKLLKEIKEWD